MTKKINQINQANRSIEDTIEEKFMSTAELYIDEETVKEFISETLADDSLFAIGREGQEYGVCPFVTFYIYSPHHGFRDKEREYSYDEDFLPLCHEVIELHQELQTLIDEPYLMVYNSNTQHWTKATPEKLGRELLQTHAKLRTKDGRSLWVSATDQESPAASARWAIFADVTDNPWMRYTTVKITFRDKWYREHKNVWYAFVNKWLQRLQPEQCYSGYEIGMPPGGILGAYESDVMERICADYFYGLDVDHPLKMGFHDNDIEHFYESSVAEYGAENVSPKEEYMKRVNPTQLGAGLRTPTWCFLLSPLWRNKLGKSIDEVKAVLRHPNIHITEIPYKTDKHNSNGEPALWIQLGELSLYPVDEGVPELPVIANRLIYPIRCNLLQLYTLDPWADDPNPRFDEENGPHWMGRFDEKSEWPTKEFRQKAKRKVNEASGYPSSILGGQPCPKAGWWFTPAKANSGRYFKEGELMPDFKSDYGLTIWQWLESQPEGK
jgi:hypothetical protein